ncbi:MAG: type II toxin-antitoxin system Phd/YefM family antitoxin [Enterobacterales bacterium]|nr:type II toxin-antitoxin system Phd/YefM family antitoxin [Enterobacterales bacterium]
MTTLYSHLKRRRHATHIQKLSLKHMPCKCLEIEETGRPRIITDRGRATLEIRKLRRNKATPLELLKGSVIKFDNPTQPIAEDDWENG